MFVLSGTQGFILCSAQLALRPNRFTYVLCRVASVG